MFGAIREKWIELLFDWPCSSVIALVCRTLFTSLHSLEKKIYQPIEGQLTDTSSDLCFRFVRQQTVDLVLSPSSHMCSSVARCRERSIRDIRSVSP